MLKKPAQSSIKNNLQVSDSGYYICYVENSVGREKSYIYLNVADNSDTDTTNTIVYT